MNECITFLGAICLANEDEQIIFQNIGAYDCILKTDMHKGLYSDRNAPVVLNNYGHSYHGKNVCVHICAELYTVSVYMYVV